jgi:hypothetical protein
MQVHEMLKFQQLTSITERAEANQAVPEDGLIAEPTARRVFLTRTGFRYA